MFFLFFFCEIFHNAFLVRDVNASHWTSMDGVEKVLGCERRELRRLPRGDLHGGDRLRVVHGVRDRQDLGGGRVQLHRDPNDAPGTCVPSTLLEVICARPQRPRVTFFSASPLTIAPSSLHSDLVVFGVPF